MGVAVDNGSGTMAVDKGKWTKWRQIDNGKWTEWRQMDNGSGQWQWQWDNGSGQWEWEGDNGGDGCNGYMDREGPTVALTYHMAHTSPEIC